ncbi:Ppx/GppA family phosphatase [Lentilactobacillus otakiensis]|uniref:Ppx/GppA family phosphatase n=1 Tax=Lentilactobacillus otakiensis TaxID=481720 RepID=UPI001CC0288F|nr:Ppx/GppA family phosphatase [Lentilactobacillus otakiensis]MBZ3776033.1 Ppx/GppA family phosphatase [Lentilactobacillus otakiensis]MDV3519186.1 Ppx/GppA family phosphatase [Lentilactobacillus otakiensis]
MENLVILDIGSNSVRMAINQITDDGSYREIKRIKSDSRLSEGMGRGKILQPAAMERTIQSLANFKKIYSQYQAKKVIGIATAAVRQAKNQAKFLKAVKDRIGISLQVLTGNQEAYYDYLGVINRLGINNCLILDIGGASCELIRVNNGQSANLTSIPIGAVNITERYHLSDNITGANLFNAQFNIRKIYSKIDWLSRAAHQPLVLLGGANRTLARINRRRQNMVRIDAIHGYHLTAEQVNRTYLNLLKGNVNRRRKIQGLEHDRADIIVGGLLPLIVLMEKIDAKKVLFSESGVREGIITEYIQKEYGTE